MIVCELALSRKYRRWVRCGRCGYTVSCRIYLICLVLDLPRSHGTPSICRITTRELLINKALLAQKFRS